MHEQTKIIAQAAYTVGLLSVLDSLLDTPMTKLIENIILSEDIRDALLSREGHLGELLDTVIAYEEGRWEILNSDQYLGQDLSKLYIDALGVVAKGKAALNSVKN